MRSRFGIERLERRLLLAGETLRFPFMAANFSFEDPSFIRQAEVLKNQRQLEFTIPDGFRSVAGGEDLYEPWGSGTTFLGWPDPGTKFFTRPNPAAGRNEVGIAGAGATVTIVLESLEPAKTVAEAMPLLVARNAARNFALSSGPEAASSKWLITGGDKNGKSVTLNGQSARFRDIIQSTADEQFEEADLEFVFPFGFDPDRIAHFIVIDVYAESSTGTSDPDIIPVSEVAGTLLQKPSVEAYNNSVLDQIETTLKFSGAIPDALFLYDFSGDATHPPASVPYLNQFEQPTLPIGGAAACGPSSITMGLGEVGTGVAVKDAYDHTMRLPPETPFGFDWQKGQNWVKTFDPHTALYREKDTWDRIEQNLNAGKPVLLSNVMGVETTAGPGHVILLLGVGENEEVKEGLRELGSSSSGDYYIVADPAGNFFANPGQGGMNIGHYGTVDGLRQLAIGINYGGWFAIYPKEKLHDWASSDHLRTLTIDPVKPAAVTTVHSPVTVMITDPLGRKTGVQPDGTVLSEIPDSEYHVAVAEDETVHAEYLLPDEGKSVVLGSLVDGTYTAQLVGTESGPFTFDIDILRPGEPQSHFSVSGTAAPGVTNTYTFTYPPASTATVVGRSVFYNNSSFDGADRTATAADDAAIAADKRALLPGQAASFADVTSYVKGINGVMVDVQGLPAGAALSADDFTVRSSAQRSVWLDGPRPSTVEVRRGAGPGGSDRITLVWPDYNPLADPAAVAVANGWMEVTVKANGHTGLAVPDVFSFGNLISDTGDSDTTFRVNALDLSAVKRALNSGSGVTGRYDFNRDGRVNALDLAAVRGNLNHTLGAITATPAAPAPASPFFSAPAANLSGSFSGSRVWEEVGSGGWTVEGS